MVVSNVVVALSAIFCTPHYPINTSNQCEQVYIGDVTGTTLPLALVKCGQENQHMINKFLAQEENARYRTKFVALPLCEPKPEPSI
jgi:hypothetical protein